MDKKIEYYDKRYETITVLFMNEIEKRKIDIRAPEFNEIVEEIIDEIVKEISKGKFFQSRFSGDNIQDVKNAILRKINKTRYNKEVDFR